MNKLLYFTAGYCQPCKMFGPTMDKVAQSGIPVSKLDVDQNPEMVQKYGIKSIPTVIKIDSTGVIRDKFSGVKTQQEVINFYNG